MNSINWLTSSILIFIIFQLLNVIISTIKYIVTVKSTPLIASLVNALSYTINAIITYLIVSHDILMVIIITFISNIIGVPIGKFIVNKFSKEKLWVYNATIRCTEETACGIRYELKELFDIHSKYEEISKDQLYSMTFFSYSKNDSKEIKNTLAMYNAKYHIVETI